VESQAFAEVLAGRDPVSGRSLRVRRGPDSVAAYDLTFAAPKSVSILHLLAPREIATEVGAGHQEAVNDATDYLGRAAVGVRRTRGGTVSFLPSTGAVSGHFVHRTSRTLDPHLHTHVVVANVAQGVDGSWSAVDSRRVYAHAHAARGVYHARLRLELSERIGATWDLHASGLGDVIGVDGNLRRLFSQRSAAMDEYRFTRAGPSQHPSRLGAFHATRPDKDRTRTVESLLLEWKRRAADFGFDLGDLTMVVGCKRNLEAGNDIDPQRVRDRLVEFAQANRTMAPRDLVAVVAAASTLGATARVVQSVARQLEEASGPPLGTERRWPAGEVARALERDSAAILAGPALSGDGRLGIGPSPATAGPQLGQGRSRADQAARSGRREASHHLTR
jgi:conjugative relaxase-like TrwC/TraI family protein